MSVLLSNIFYVDTIYTPEAVYLTHPQSRPSFTKRWMTTDFCLECANNVSVKDKKNLN